MTATDASRTLSKVPVTFKVPGTWHGFSELTRVKRSFFSNFGGGPAAGWDAAGRRLMHVKVMAKPALGHAQKVHEQQTGSPLDVLPVRFQFPESPFRPVFRATFFHHGSPPFPASLMAGKPGSDFRVLGERDQRRWKPRKGSAVACAPNRGITPYAETQCQRSQKGTR